MSDIPGQAPPPPGAPAPPPPPPPPPPGQQPAYGAPAPMPAAPVPAAPAAPAKKSKKGLWIALAIILALLLCCGCGAGFFIYQAAQESAAYEETFTDLEAASEKFAAMDPPAPADDPEGFVDEVQPAIAEFRSAIDKAVGEIEKRDDSDKKDNALGALGSLDKALEKLGSAMDGITSLGTLQTDIESMAADVKTGDDAVSEAIDHANNKRWNEAQAKVDVALTSYRSAEAKMKALETAWPGVGMTEMTGIVHAKLAAAEDAAALVRYGRQGKYNAYNDTINAYNAHQRDIRAANQPAFIENPELLTGDLEKTLAEVEAETEKALKALEELEQ